MNLETLLKEFLEYLEIERNVSYLTIRNYKHYLERFLAFLGSPILGDSSTPSVSREAGSDSAGKILKPSDITAESIRQYRLFLSRFTDAHQMTLKRVTQNYHLIALRSFLKYLNKRDIAVISPDKIELPKAESHSIKFLDHDQVIRLLNQPEISKTEGLRDKAILETLFSTGLRVSELVSLNREQVNLERREFGVVGKGRRVRIVFLSDSSVIWIQRYLATREDQLAPLFIRYSGKKPDEHDTTGSSIRLTARSIQRLVDKYAKKQGFP